MSEARRMEPGNSDVSLSVAPDGTLYLVELEFDPGGQRQGSCVTGVSMDSGNVALDDAEEHWEDRPWQLATTGPYAGSGNRLRGRPAHSSSREILANERPAVLNPTGGSETSRCRPHGKVAVRIVPGYAEV